MKIIQETFCKAVTDVKRVAETILPTEKRVSSLGAFTLLCISFRLLFVIFH